MRIYSSNESTIPQRLVDSFLHPLCPSLPRTADDEESSLTKDEISHTLSPRGHTVVVYGPYNKEVRTFRPEHPTTQHHSFWVVRLVRFLVFLVSCLAAVKLGQTNEEREGKEKKRKLSVTSHCPRLLRRWKILSYSTVGY
jgi:hypothetical protein